MPAPVEEKPTAPSSGAPPEGVWPDVMPRPELRIALAYMVVGSLWVIASDRLLNQVLPGSPISLQTCKGINFVITTGVVLFFVLRRAYRGWRQSEREQRALLSEMNTMFRDLSSRVESLREEDRTRISRELHDQLGQALTGLKMDLRWIENRLERREEREINPLIDRLVEAEEQIDGLTLTVRRIATDLRPESLDQLGLPAALHEEAERFTSRTGEPCEIEFDALPQEIPPAVGTAAFRIFQEALTNVARHAGATRVWVTCSSRGDALEITIADDGKGIPAGEETKQESLGLLGMRERAEMLGGRLRVDANPAGGTRVTATLPWRVPT
jgi:signal transduction histidine kinase